MSPISSASQALVSAENRFGVAAATVAATPLSASTAQAVVDLTGAREQFRAAVATFRVADDTMKSLLDIVA